MKSNVNQRMQEVKDKNDISYVNKGVHATLAAVIYVLYRKKYTKANIRKIYEELKHTLTNLPLVFDQHITDADMINFCKSKIGIDVTEISMEFKEEKERKRK